MQSIYGYKKENREQEMLGNKFISFFFSLMKIRIEGNNKYLNLEKSTGSKVINILEVYKWSEIPRGSRRDAI